MTMPVSTSTAPMSMAYQKPSPVPVRVSGVDGGWDMGEDEVLSVALACVAGVSCGVADMSLVLPTGIQDYQRETDGQAAGSVRAPSFIGMAHMRPALPGSSN
ncbi:MAG: hypothetical protein CVT73_05080 [Alphaproteobacteria bacterium HGW-Alphaproteobacteria-12]|nr:MAG: hypothetical protein CVT73_05080 [Alphaproteobacteria bacterium HGW-Alphaproteobacteria-12]